MRIVYYASVFLGIEIIHLAGCIGQGSNVGDLTFSPDGEQICYLREDKIEEKVVDGKVWFRSISLHWCSTNNPASRRSIHIDSLGRDFGHSTVLRKVKWSPGGSWIGVLTPHRLTAVATDTGDKCEIRDGAISSFAWCSKNEVFYSTNRRIWSKRRPVICREDLSTRQRTDVVTFADRPVEEVGGHRGYWSPSGRWAILMEPSHVGQYSCVDASLGTVHAFGQHDAYVVGVSWMPDSSHAFCVSGRVGMETLHEAVLYEPATATVVDCTGGFRQTFRDDRHLHIEPVWTPDGHYVLVNSLNAGGTLVQPDPWKVIPLGRLTSPQLTGLGPLRINPTLFWLPVPGWIGVRPTGTYADSPYVADYSGKRVVPLLVRDGPPAVVPHAVSPDGTMGAIIGVDGHLRICSLDRSWLSPETRQGNDVDDGG